MSNSKLIDKLAWIYIKDKQILTARSKGKDTYYIPGGKRENGESDQEALTREIKEELNVELFPNSLEFIGIFEAQAHSKPTGTIVRMTCYAGDYEGEMSPASEIEEVRWLKHKDKILTSTVDMIIFDWLKEKGLIN